MRRKLRGLLLGVAIGFSATFLAGMMVTRNLAIEGTYTYLRLFNEVLSLVRSSYVDEADTDTLMKGAYEGLVSELDPFSEYLTAEEYDRYVAAGGKGVRGDRRGADPGLRVARKEGLVLVVSVRPGSDAEAKGITAGDLIRRLDDRSTREMSLEQIESILAGPPGSPVAVSLARREEPRKLDAELVRRETPAEPTSLEVVDPKDGIAVLKLPHLSGGVASEVAAALDRAERQKVRRLLIDLRGNAWGTMDEAAAAAGLFLGDAVVARLKSKEGVVREIRGGRARSAYSGSVALLINAGTAEAAELFAAALRDEKDATLLGEPSFGVGAEQEYIPLKNGAWLKLSVRKYLSPSGEAWHGSGLKPDTAIVVTQENLKPPERLRQQLRMAIEEIRAPGKRQGAARASTTGGSGPPAEEGGGS